MAPFSAKVVEKLFKKYLNQDAYVCLEGQVQTAIQITNSLFDQFVYTGSTQKGKLVAQAAAKNLIPCILELGGKSPMVIDESADI